MFQIDISIETLVHGVINVHGYVVTIIDFYELRFFLSFFLSFFLLLRTGTLFHVEF